MCDVGGLSRHDSEDVLWPTLAAFRATSISWDPIIGPNLTLRYQPSGMSSLSTDPAQAPVAFSLWWLWEWLWGWL
ncbi:hypothetical protein RRF57_002626 [Xylaria bambusicola]|uniref:Uncharacterized protein n=1 Tax=Xylaria bambusicola TaxID=326684 RepID=A0AAN7UIZ3_9PEZI